MKLDKSVKRFMLPDQGTFLPNGPDDPLPYYYKPLVGRLYQARIEQALSLLTPPYKSILEIGYGSGILLPSLNKMCSSLTGVDLQPIPNHLIDNLKTLNVQCTLIEGDIGNNTLSESSFDLVVAISVFEHISDFESIVRRIINLIKPSGQLLVGMPRVDKFMEKVFRIIGYSEIGNHHISNHKDFLKFACSNLDLIAVNHMPQMVPKYLGLYFTMLFEKNGITE